MKQRLNPDWIKLMQERINTIGYIEHTDSHSLATQWLVSYLDIKGIPFKVINLGAGVKKVTTKMDICPKCKGMGKV